MSGIRHHLTGGVVVGVIALALLLSGVPQVAQAGVIGPLTLSNATCGGVTLQFYYDGMTSPACQHDSFRVEVWRMDCTTSLCPDESTREKIADYWQAVPPVAGEVSIAVSWDGAVTAGSFIEVRVGQYDLSGSAPRLVVSDFREQDELGNGYICNTAATSASVAALGVQCTAGGFQVLANNAPVLTADYADMANALNTARLLDQHQRIASANGVSLWALSSNELQAHYDADPDGTKLIVPADMCGSPSAWVTAAPCTTCGTSYAGTTSTAWGTGGQVHIVQPGENLFRISLRYGVSMSAIAAANGITNYNLIFVGQRLIIP